MAALQPPHVLCLPLFKDPVLNPAPNRLLVEGLLRNWVRYDLLLEAWTGLVLFGAHRGNGELIDNGLTGCLRVIADQMVTRVLIRGAEAATVCLANTALSSPVKDHIIYWWTLLLHTKRLYIPYISPKCPDQHRDYYYSIPPSRLTVSIIAGESVAVTAYTVASFLKFLATGWRLGEMTMNDVMRATTCELINNAFNASCGGLAAAVNKMMGGNLVTQYFLSVGITTALEALVGPFLGPLAKSWQKCRTYFFYKKKDAPPTGHQMATAMPTPPNMQVPVPLMPDYTPHEADVD